MKGYFVFIFFLHFIPLEEILHFKIKISFYVSKFPVKISLYVSKFRVVTKMLMSSVLESSYKVQFFKFHSLNLLDSGTL